MCFTVYISPLIPRLEALNIGLMFGVFVLVILLCVDDIALLGASLDEIRIGVREVLRWCHENRMRLNFAKCKVLVIGPRARAIASATNHELRIDFQANDNAPALHFVLAVLLQLKYLGMIIMHNLQATETIAVARKQANAFRRGASNSWRLFQDLPRAALVTAFVAHAHQTVEWAAPVWGHVGQGLWNALEQEDNRDSRRVLRRNGIMYANSLGTAALLQVLPLRLRVLRRSARRALRFAIILSFDPLYRLIIRELLQAGDSALCRASFRRILDACRDLGLPLPDSTDVRAQWFSQVSTAIRNLFDQSLRDCESLRLLSVYRPPKDWCRDWILCRSPTDQVSEFLAAVLLDRWPLVPDIRGMAMRPVRRGICDLCHGSHDASNGSGSLEAVLFLCPELAAPRAVWFARGRAVAAAANAAWWWDSVVAVGPPATHTLAAALFGFRAFGRPRLWVTRATLRHNLTAAFVSAFLPWLCRHREVLSFFRTGVLPSPPSSLDPLL